MSDAIPITPVPVVAHGERLEPSEELGRLWERGARDDVDALLNAIGPLSATQLAEVLHVDQHHRWRAGERTTAETYLQRFPDICTEADAAVDLIFHEYLLRERLGERPVSQEYLDRFPAYAQALESQIAFHSLLKNYDSPLAEPLVPPANLANPAQNEWPPSVAPHAQIGFVPRGGLSSNRELQPVLRKRLRIFSFICCAMFIVLVPVVFTVVSGFWGVAIYSVVIVETGLSAALLLSRQPLSIRALRWIEACLMGTLMVYFAWEQVQFFQAGVLSKLVGDGWIGPSITARANSWNWALTMIIYGMWIPNTARRAIIVVAAMIIVYLAVTLGLALMSPLAPPDAVAGFVLYSTTHIFGAAVIAIFGAYRIQTLQRRVSEAHKLGPYRLIRRLGAGGMGEVYLAEHALLRRPCALKLIRAEHVGDERLLSRFEREVQTMASLTHPNTVRVYDYGLAADGTFYYAMEYLQGMSLDELVTRYGRLPPERVVFLVRQVCPALREAHAVGLVHRDIKPANILACRAGGMDDVAKLLDFGLVRVHGLSKDGNNLTGVGSIAGTPAFMSPEQAADATEVDSRSDIYSLGAVAYFLLVGRPPFMHANAVETMAAHLNEQVVPPHRLCPELPCDLDEVIMRCMEKDPARRFQDLLAVEDALAHCACGNTWSVERAADWWRTRPLVASERDANDT